MLLVGSKALEKHISIGRKSKDWDYIATHDEIGKWMLFNCDNIKNINKTEHCVTVRMHDKSMFEFLLASPRSALSDYMELDKKKGFASVETLYSMKLGHIHFAALGQIKFNKHIADITILGALCKKTDVLHELTKKHTANTAARIGIQKNISLDKSPEQFFGQSDEKVKSWFVHDQIHEIVAHDEHPTYQSMQEDEHSVKCSKYLWDKFPLQKKINCVLEEAYVIALERKIIPMLFGSAPMIDSESAFDWAMYRICTNLCSGWFRKFAVDYYAEIRAYHSTEYAAEFFAAVDKGEIKTIR